MRREEEIMFMINELEMLYNNIESAFIIGAVTETQLEDVIEKRNNLYNTITESLELFEIEEDTASMLKDRIELVYLKHDESMKTIVFYR